MLLNAHKNTCKVAEAAEKGLVKRICIEAEIDCQRAEAGTIQEMS